MRRIVTVVVLLGLAGCSGDGTGIAGFGDPCGWLPVPNQEAAVDAMGDLRDDGYGRTEVFAILFNGLTSGPSVFNPSPQEASYCLDVLLDEAY